MNINTSMADPENSAETTPEEILLGYMAGALDGGGTLSVSIAKSSNTSVGYRLMLVCRIERAEKALPKAFADFCDMMGVDGTLKEKSNGNWAFTVSSLDDVQEFVALLEPYLIVKKERAQVLLDEVIPRMRNRDHHSTDGILELMPYVDTVNGVDGASNRKYTTEFFEKEFGETA